MSSAIYRPFPPGLYIAWLLLNAVFLFLKVMDMKKKTKKKNYDQKEAYFYILPIFIFFGIYSLYPLIFNIYYSFTDWNGISQSWNFVGLENFKNLCSDRVIRIVLKNTVLYFVGTIIPQAFFGLVLAYIISRMKRFSQFLRAAFYFPNILPLTIVCITFMKIFETQDGELNHFLTAAGLGSLCRQWLAKPGWALFTLILINIWTYTSFSMLLYCISMTNIPDELYEAATIDGANGFQRFLYITFPLLSTTHVTLLLMGMISVVKNFDIPYVITQGGPAHSTEFFSTYMYSLSFDKFDQGGAAAVVCLMLAISVVLTIFQLRGYGVQLKKKEM